MTFATELPGGQAHEDSLLPHVTAQLSLVKLWSCCFQLVGPEDEHSTSARVQNNVAASGGGRAQNGFGHGGVDCTTSTF